jgi:uncharacterized protein
MKILIDILHPAHVHFFKNFITAALQMNHEILVTSREKEMTNYLLQAYNIKYTSISSIGKNQVELAKELVCRNLKCLTIAKQFKPDIMLGIMGPTIAPIAKLLDIPCLVFYDTEHAKITNSWVYPLSTAVITPSSYQKNLGNKHIKYNGYHELAYLHPNYFKPDPSVLEHLNLTKNEKFAIIRFVSWEASHDVGKKGINLENKKKCIKELSKQLPVFISSEHTLPADLQQYTLSIPYEKIHDVLNFAHLYFGEGATMASEAAILGTPSIYVNTLKLGYIQELQDTYQLIYSFDKFEQAYHTVSELLQQKKDIKQEWIKKKNMLIKEKTDVTKFIIDILPKFSK